MSWWSEQTSALPKVLRAERATGVAPASLPLLAVIETHQELQGQLAVDEAPSAEELFESGVAEGRRAQSKEDAARRREEVEPLLAALHKALDDLEAEAAKSFELVERGVAQLALRLAEEIVGHELRAFPEIGEETLARCMRLAPPEGDVVVRVDPASAEVLAETVERRGSDRPWATSEPYYGLDRRFSVVADESVGRGGCVVEVGPVTIDAQVEAALARVRHALSLEEAS